MNDVGERWPTKEMLREQGSRDLGLLTGAGDGEYQFGYTKEDATRALVRLSGATEEARRRMKQRYELLSTSSSTSAAYLFTKAVRSSMETVYPQRSKTGRKPPLRNQGRDQFLARLSKR